MVIRRGEIWWATLPEPRGSEPGYRRPVLVIQTDPFNASRIQTVVVIAITSNLRLAEAPGNVYLAAKSSGLPLDSVANVSQIVTFDKRFLESRVRALAKRELALVGDGLRMVLGL
jgi:mRNA interferase MazF